MEFPRRYRLVKVPGTDDIYDLEPAPGEVIDEGTFYNKANQLRDETAVLIGLDPADDPTVNEALAVIGQALAEGAQIERGKYQGTDIHGTDVSMATSITFGIIPDIVFISEVSNYGGGSRTICLPYHWGAPYVVVAYSTASSPSALPILIVTVDGKKMSWYCQSGSNSYRQLNSSEREYSYVAIGKKEEHT